MPKIEYTDKKGEGRQHKKPVEIYKKIKIAIEYEWDIGKDGCHFFTRDFPKLAHIKADYYIVIYLNPKKYNKTQQNLKNISSELGFGSNNVLVVELLRDDSSKTFTINRIKVDREQLNIEQGNSIQCNQSK